MYLQRIYIQYKICWFISIFCFTELGDIFHLYSALSSQKQKKNRKNDLHLKIQFMKTSLIFFSYAMLPLIKINMLYTLSLGAQTHMVTFPFTPSLVLSLI